jgi:lipooligosaccharide transport system permease protein
MSDATRIRRHIDGQSRNDAAGHRLRRLEPAAISGVMSREVANFRTYWRGTTFSSVLEPIVYLIAFGLGLSATLVDEVEGVPYVQYVGTGMVATAVIFSSAMPAMFGTFVKHRFQNTYDAILAAPVDVEELVSAEMLWIGARASVYGCVPLLVTIGFGLDPAWGMLLTPIFAFVTALGFAGFGVTMAAIVAKIDQFNYVTALFVTPLFLVSGAFFPISGLPEGFQVLAQLNPLHQLVELVRGGAFGYEAVDLLRFAGLLAFALVMWRIAVNRMEARLID